MTEVFISTDHQKRTWGSHIPVNRSILKTFDITGVMELGIGRNSTPIFHDHCDLVISVETDKEWIEAMTKEIKTNTNHKIIHHRLNPPVRRQTAWHRAPKSVLEDAPKFWLPLCNEQLNLLFIDCISSLRYKAFVDLHDKFDFIVMHDYEQTHKRNARQKHWRGGVPCPPKFNLFVDESFTAWTAVMINREFDSLTDKWMKSHEQMVEEHLPGHIPKLKKWGVEK